MIHAKQVTIKIRIKYKIRFNKISINKLPLILYST